MAIELTDDGTLDTVLRCTECGEEMRYTYVPYSDDDDYDAFIEWAIEDAESEHVCASDEPSEPEDGDLTTGDHRTFYQYGRPVFEVSETVDGNYMLLINGFQVGGTVDRSGAGDATYKTVEDCIRAYMDRVQFWPNCWFISDHGNAHLINMSEKEE